VASYDDPAGLAELAAISDVITYEFENVPVEAAETLAGRVPVLPPPRALEVSQDRLGEKQFLNGIGIDTAPFLAVDSDADLASALHSFGGNGVLKTRRMGYDGKGQRVFRHMESGSYSGVFEAMGSVPLILEGLISFECEISVIGARGADGSVETYAPARNVHRDGILHTSTVPAAVPDITADVARAAAASILERDRAAGAQFRPLDRSRLRRLAVRAARQGHCRAAAGRHAPSQRLRDGEPDRRRCRARA
jgi:5-(carboxyamino)imidazole ribonucleotide synthase